MPDLIQSNQTQSKLLGWGPANFGAAPIDAAQLAVIDAMRARDRLRTEADRAPSAEHAVPRAARRAEPGRTDRE